MLRITDHGKLYLLPPFPYHLLTSSPDPPPPSSELAPSDSYTNISALMRHLAQQLACAVDEEIRWPPSPTRLETLFLSHCTGPSVLRSTTSDVNPRAGAGLATAMASGSAPAGARSQELGRRCAPEQRVA